MQAGRNASSIALPSIAKISSGFMLTQLPIGTRKMKMRFHALHLTRTQTKSVSTGHEIVDKRLLGWFGLLVTFKGGAEFSAMPLDPN